jgi:hypothetical protein
MTAPIKINRDLPDHRSKVKFRNHDKPCFVLSADKAASDAKNFREAAKLLGAVEGDRAKNVAAWLNETAGKYDEGGV